MRKLIWSLPLLLLLFSCGDGRTELEKAQEGAMVAAETYYGFLLNGSYEQFLQGREGMAGIPDSFREQLLTTYKQFMAQQAKAHGGIRSVKSSRAVPDSSLNVMQVFLLLNYQDASTEEIVVPMVQDGDQWMMRCPSSCFL